MSSRHEKLFLNYGLVRLGLKQHVLSVERKMKGSFFGSNYLSYCPEVSLKISSEFTKTPWSSHQKYLVVSHLVMFTDIANSLLNTFHLLLILHNKSPLLFSFLRASIVNKIRKCKFFYQQ